MPLAFGLSSVLPFLTITVFVVVFVILNLKSSPSVTASALYPFSEVRNASGYTGGLKVNTTPAQGGTFTLTVSGIRCLSPSFTSSLSIAHFDKEKNLKEVNHL